jgi:uncharacterized alkaline shock family protein YloU
MQIPYCIRKLFGIKVYALVGRSGTGKSFRARLIAGKYGIDLIIDDGLLIKDDNIIAGKSAKSEKVYLTAIKTALFDSVEHRTEVRNKLNEEQFTKILLIGTSVAMVERIAKRLHLPKPSKVIQIEDIAKEEEIEQALKERATGRHVIPIPQVEVEKDYGDIISGAFKKTIRIGKGLFSRKKKVENTVVHPTFAPGENPGHVTISKAALIQMIMHCADEFDSSIKIKKIKLSPDSSGAYKIKLFLNASYKTQLSGNFHNFQKYISQSLTRYTGIQIKEVNLEIDQMED